MVCWMPLSVSTARIVAFGMPALDGSLIVPVMSPEEPTPCACTEPAVTIRQNKSHTCFIGFIGPPSRCASFRGGKAVATYIPHREANRKHYLIKVCQLPPRECCSSPLRI